MKNNFSKFLITGGAGFIGANFIHYLLQHHNPEFILNFDKLSYAADLTNLKLVDNDKRYHFIQGDINDANTVSEILHEYQIDILVHFAAETHVDRSIQHPEIFVKNNIVGTQTLLEVTKRYWLEKHGDENSFRFHHISTDEVYGSLELQEPAFTEKTPYAPNSPYAASKASANHLVHAYYKTYGLPISISNCSNNFGRFQHQEKLIPKIIQACIYQQPITLYGDGSQIRDWLDVDDHCRAIALICQNNCVGETYNVGGSHEVTNLQLATQICGILDELYPSKNPYQKLITFVEDRPGHDKRYAINSSKIARALQWKPQATFSEALRKTISWYLQTKF